MGNCQCDVRFNILSVISVSWTDAICLLTCASGLVKAVNTAVDLIVAHFGTSRDPGVKVFSTIRVYIALTEFCLYETLTLLILCYMPLVI